MQYIIAFTSIILVLYSLFEKIGLLSDNGATVRGIVYSYPFLITATCLAVAVLWRSVLSGKPRVGATGKEKVARFAVLAGIFLLPVGLWTSYLTHFEGSVIRMSQQDFLTLPGEYDEVTLYRGPLARPNSIGLYIKDISVGRVPFFNSVNAEADVRYISRSRTKFGETRIGTFRPLFSDWTMARITGAGYSVAYAINDQTKRDIDRTYVALKLFPPGAEDFFSPKDLGYYFHLRFFPDYVDKNGQPATQSLDPKNPVFAVRVVRNKDILYNGLMTLNNRLQIEGILFSIKDVRPCVEITFIRDLGLPVMALGALLLIIAALLRRLAAGKLSNSEGTDVTG